MKTKRKSGLEKSLSEKYVHIQRCQKKWGLSHRNPEKSGHSYTFCWTKGANHIPGSGEKGAIRHAYPYYAMYRKLPSTHHPHPHENIRHNPLNTTIKLQKGQTWKTTPQRAAILPHKMQTTPEPKNLSNAFLTESDFQKFSYRQAMTYTLAFCLNLYRTVIGPTGIMSADNGPIEI